MENEARGEAPGLKWRPRADGRQVPMWYAKPAAIAAGYSPKSVNLSSVPVEQLADRCRRLEAEMKDFLGGRSIPEVRYDGTLGSLIDVYQTHARSPFRKLKPASAIPYLHYCGVLKRTVGTRSITRLNGLDVMAWHEKASEPRKPGGKRLVAGARMMISVLKAALSFGAVCGIAECQRLHATLRLIEFEKPKSRSVVLTAAHVVKLREAAHATGRPSIAFLMALQFETSIRLWDLLGQWVPLDDPRPSAVLRPGLKWFGPTWSSIGPDMVFRLVASKTEETTAAEHEVDLHLCPMVLEELERIPREARRGPLIVNEATGVPFDCYRFDVPFRKVRDAAGLPSTVWARDLRASAVTEARKAGADMNDVAKGAGHSAPGTTARVYDRDRIEAHRRVATLRLIRRNSAE